jgi:lipoprotein signal peptidase
LGNFIDRVLYGEVLDFITTPLLPWVFNFADIFINGGMLIFIAGSLLSHPESDPDEIATDNAPLP